MVIVGHFFGFRANALFPVEALDSVGLPFGTKSFAIVSSLGVLGVCFFFMISGYLITSLLVAEEEKRGRVSLKAFYVRRVFRIMPAFYAYVLVVFLLGRAGLILVPDEAVLRSSVYVCNFSGFSCSWWLAHTWSLAVEEQFYLIWPMIFAFAAVWRRAAAITILAALLVASAFFEPLSGFTYIMAGVFVALAPRTRDRLSGIDRRVIWLALALLVAFPVAPSSIGRFLMLAQPLMVAVVLFGTLFGAPGGILDAVLRHPWLSKIGLVSYSLYLWQQLSLAPVMWGGKATDADALYALSNVALGLAFIPLAIASYLLIEKPLTAVGHRISRKILDQSGSAVRRTV